MRLKLDYNPGDRVFYAKKQRLGAEVRSGYCSEIVVRRDGVFARIDNHGLAPVDAVFASPVLAEVACQVYNDELERGRRC